MYGTLGWTARLGEGVTVREEVYVADGLRVAQHTAGGVDDVDELGRGSGQPLVDRRGFVPELGRIQCCKPLEKS